MRLDAEGLKQHVARGLAPVYLLAGDEPLLIDECAAVIAAEAQRGGYERHQRQVETGFDWPGFQADLHAPSLFSPRALYELRLPTGKPGDAGGKALTALAQKPPAETIVVVIAGKLEKSTQESAWVKAITAAGVFVPVWQLDGARLPAWIAARLRAAGVRAEPGVAEVLAYHMEGNLLACAQEIDKLALLFGAESVTPAVVAECLSDSSRFSVYHWVDACLAGDAGDMLRKFARVRGDGTDAVLMLWALTRELRQLSAIALRIARGDTATAAMQAAHVWSQRQSVVGRALKRLGFRACAQLLARAAAVERVVKGQAPGDRWQELELLALACCGVAARTPTHSRPGAESAPADLNAHLKVRPWP